MIKRKTHLLKKMIDLKNLFVLSPAAGGKDAEIWMQRLEVQLLLNLQMLKTQMPGRHALSGPVIPPKTITSVNPRAVVVYPCRVPALFTLLLTDGYVKIKGIDQKNQNLIAGPYTESCSVTGSILILPLTDAHYFREGASLFRRWHYDGQHA
jgi:hypothetical protein